MENNTQALPQAAHPWVLSPQQPPWRAVQLFRAQATTEETPFTTKTPQIYACIWAIFWQMATVSHSNTIHFVSSFPRRWQCLLGGVSFSNLHKCALDQ